MTVQVEMSQILTSRLNSVQVYAYRHARYFIKNRIITQKEWEPPTFQLDVSLTTNGTDFTGWAASLLACCVYQWMRGPAWGEDKDKEDKVKGSKKDTDISGLKDLLGAVTNWSKNFKPHAFGAFDDLFQATSGTNNSKSANVCSIIRLRPSSQDTYKM